MKIQGKAISPGIGVGSVVLRSRLSVAEVRAEFAALSVSNVEVETARFRSAIERVRVRVRLRQDALRAAGQSNEAGIFEAHELLLADPEWIGTVVSRLAVASPVAEVVLAETTQEWITQFEQMEDELFRARAADLRDLWSQIHRELGGTSVEATGSRGAVLWSEETLPSDLDGSVAWSALIAERGSTTAHAAILARAQGIPAVFGVSPEEGRRLRGGDLVIVDGTRGEIEVSPSSAALSAAELQVAQDREEDERARAFRGRSSRSADQITFAIGANIGKASDATLAAEVTADKVGLFRSEFLFLGRADLPNEREQEQAYSAAVRAMAGKPVVIRLLDVGGDKELPALKIPKEENPFLGLRAIRLLLQRPELLRTQLRALISAARGGDLRIMIPMVNGVEDVRPVREILKELGGAHLPLGAMIEVPSAVWCADALAKECDFFSVGTNDLVQYTLAADRGNPAVAEWSNPYHPSVIRSLDRIAQVARAEGRTVSICGEMAAVPENLGLWAALGIHELSMNSRSVLKLRSRLSQLKVQDWVARRDDLLRATSAQEVEQVLRGSSR